MPDIVRRSSDGEGARTSPPLTSIPLTSTLAPALPYASAALLGPAARHRLEAITDRLPATLTRRVYLECRLGEHGEQASRVDVIVCVDDSSRAVLMDPARAWLAPPLQPHPVWSGVGRLCSTWADAGSRVARHIYDVWLEFDAVQGPTASGPLIPSVFVGLVRGAPPRELWAAGRECLEMVTGRQMDPQVRAAVRHVIERLPPVATLSYVGVMYPRSQRAIRLCVSPLAGGTLLGCLGAIGWPGPVDELASLLRSIPCGPGATALDSTTLLHVDVLDGVGARIGLEIPLQQSPQVIAGIVEPPLLDALCERALCSPAKRDALLRWPGYSREWFPHQCWPSLALRRVSHVKVTYEPGQPPETKTYLSVFHHFSTRGARRWDTPRA